MQGRATKRRDGGATRPLSPNPRPGAKHTPPQASPLGSSLVSLGRSLKGKVHENRNNESLVASTFYLKGQVIADCEKEHLKGFSCGFGVLCKLELLKAPVNSLVLLLNSPGTNSTKS